MRARRGGSAVARRPREPVRRPRARRGGLGGRDGRRPRRAVSRNRSRVRSEAGGDALTAQPRALRRGRRTRARPRPRRQRRPRPRSRQPARLSRRCRTSPRCRSATRSSAARCSSASIAPCASTWPCSKESRVTRHRRGHRLRRRSPVCAASRRGSCRRPLCPFAPTMAVTACRRSGMRRRRTAPAVLLVHCVMRTHADWDVVARPLHEAGFGVLALDLRGHGASAVDPADALRAVQQDVKAAARLAEDAAGCAADRHRHRRRSNSARRWRCMAAGADPAVRSIALLSPAVGVPRPALRRRRCARSPRDRARCCWSPRAATRTRRDRRRQLAEIDARTARPAHRRRTSRPTARALLADQPDLVGALVDWFRRTLL